MRVEGTDREKGKPPVDVLVEALAAIVLAVSIFTLGWLSACFIIWEWIGPLSTPLMRFWAVASVAVACREWWRAQHG